jgi:hypothetical protein
MTKHSISVPTNDLRALFDIAVESMDFGSGFLDDDEVKVLRRIAISIGVDPMEGTPFNYVKKFPHTFDGIERNVYDWSITDPHKREASAVRKALCRCCSEDAEYICHVEGGLPND